MREEAVELALADLVTKGVQTRSGLREGAVVEYAAVLQAGGTLDPATAFRDQDGTLYLPAGQHRKEAYRRAGRQSMPCFVKEGSRWAAIQFGIQDNQQHRGERLTAADRRHSVLVVLSENPGLSDRAIADLCEVSPTTVGDCRKRLGVQTGQSPERIGRDGRVYDTSNLARKPATEAPGTGGCSCGGAWESDGNGGRFCPECLASHPETPSVVDGPEEPSELDDGGQPVGVKAKPQRKPVENWFDDAVHYLGECKKALDELGEVSPGPDYRRIMDLLDKAGKWLKQWRESHEAQAA